MPDIILVNPDGTILGSLETLELPKEAIYSLGLFRIISDSVIFSHTDWSIKEWPDMECLISLPKQINSREELIEFINEKTVTETPKL